MVDVLDTLTISPAQLRVLGIVSGNDYDQSKFGLGIRKNYTLITELPIGQNNSELAIYNQYCDNEDQFFDAAFRIFVEKKETGLDVQKKLDLTEKIQALDEMWTKLVNRLNLFSLKRSNQLLNLVEIDDTATIRAKLRENGVEIKKQWKPNMFKPLG